MAFLCGFRDPAGIGAVAASGCRRVPHAHFVAISPAREVRLQRRAGNRRAPAWRMVCRQQRGSGASQRVRITPHSSATRLCSGQQLQAQRDVGAGRCLKHIARAAAGSIKTAWLHGLHSPLLRPRTTAWEGCEGGAGAPEAGVMMLAAEAAQTCSASARSIVSGLLWSADTHNFAIARDRTQHDFVCSARTQHDRVPTAAGSLQFFAST